MLAFFKDLKQAGWQRYISLSGPRLTGKDALKYASTHTYELDPDYPYSFDEWMQLEDGSRWMLQANGIYLTIQMYREQSKMDPQQPWHITIREKTEAELKAQGITMMESYHNPSIAIVLVFCEFTRLFAFAKRKPENAPLFQRLLKNRLPALKDEIKHIGKKIVLFLATSSQHPFGED
ncbi:hypothetical protein FQR65_LT20267 [Abscondita terminalis]|nr:hypothetical protein FQR65_LT20267 [Abscondita terminalis]